jgi:tetratricopeptide (TPR) repeat protein
MVSVFLLLLLLSGPGAGQAASSPADPAPLDHERSLMQQGKTEEALAIMQQLAAGQPVPKGLHHDLGIGWYRIGKLAEAEKEFVAAVQEDPSDQESVQMQGLTLYRMGQPARAIPLLERVRQWMPNADADSNYVLGLCYLNSRRYDDARAAFAQEFSVDPASASAYLLLSTMLMHANLPELAADQARKALDLDPKLPLAHFRIGEVALFKSNVAEATQELEQERRLNPGYAPTYDRLGDVYLRTGKLQESQEALTKAISLDVTSTGPFIQMGKVLLHRDDPDTALLYLRHAEKMDPSNYITHTLLAQAYRRQGHEDQAKHEMELAGKIHTDNQFTLQPVQ